MSNLEFNSFYSETCDLFHDSDGVFFVSKKCQPTARYCCGTCTNRYCCSLSKERLNQYECKSLNGNKPSSSPSGNSPNQNNTFSYIYPIYIIGSILLFAFSCIPLMIFMNNKTQKRRSDNIIAFQNLSKRLAD